MMNHQHVPQDLLASFVDGDVGEQLAVHIAEHLDGCPSCATRAVSMEPLAAAFAAVDDPEPADWLVTAVLEELALPARRPTQELAIGTALLGSAALLVAGTGDPVGTAVNLGVIIRAALGALGSVVSSNGSAALLTLSGLATLVGCIIAARLAVPDRRSP
jgi:anti-sigma factor RsiW